MNGSFGSTKRPNENITSSAFISRVGVKAGVVWNFTPRRNVNVKVLASGETVHAVANCGTICELPRLKATRPWNICVVALLVLVLSHKAGSKPSGLASAQYTSGLAAACAVAAKRASKPAAMSRNGTWAS